MSLITTVAHPQPVVPNTFSKQTKGLIFGCPLSDACMPNAFEDSFEITRQVITPPEQNKE